MPYRIGDKEVRRSQVEYYFKNKTGPDHWVTITKTLIYLSWKENSSYFNIANYKRFGLKIPDFSFNDAEKTIRFSRNHKIVFHSPSLYSRAKSIMNSWLTADS